jgi:hypothetical protein
MKIGTKQLKTHTSTIFQTTRPLPIYEMPSSAIALNFPQKPLNISG